MQQADLHHCGECFPASGLARSNRGWFVPGDPRINLAGRPKSVAAAMGLALKRGGLSRKLMRLFVPESDLRQYLTGQPAPWLTNLPRDFRLVAFDLDASRGGVTITLWSEAFDNVPERDTVPEMAATYNGLKWRSHDRRN